MSSIREVQADEIAAAVRELCMEICYRVPPEMVELMKRAREREESPLGRQILDQLLENQESPPRASIPYCQDTGYTVVFLDLGQDVHVAGGDLYEAIDRGVRGGTRTATCAARSCGTRSSTGGTPGTTRRRSCTRGSCRRRDPDPGRRQGRRQREHGQHAMLKPADGLEGVKRFVLEAVAESRPERVPAGDHRRRRRRELRDVAR